MNNKLLCAFAFTAGAAVGALVSWKILKTKYEEIAREEIASVKEVYSRRNLPEVVEYDEPENLEEEANNAANILTSEGYIDYSTSEPTKPAKGEEEEDDVEGPYVISPDEFGELEDYDTESLTYYADGVLADDRDFVIDDIEGTVGRESLNTFGKYEEDSVFVRNDRLETDYEILLDERKYCDVARIGPGPSDDE